MLASAVFKDAASGNQPNWKDPPRGKVLTKTTTSKKTGAPTGVTGTMLNMQMKTTFFKEITTRREIILVGSTSKCSDSRKTETLCKKLEASRKVSDSFKNCKGIRDSFSFSIGATGVAKGNSSQSKRKIRSGGGDWKSLEIGFNRKSSYKKDFCLKSV